MNPAIVQNMIHAKESGKPSIRGVAEEKIVYPGQMIISEINVIMMKKIHLGLREVEFLAA